MEIQNPRRALAVSLHSDRDHLSRTLHELTGSKPTPTEDSLAGTTHNLALKTKYYAATVPIWLDLIDDAEEWAASFLSTEASEVLAVLGGLILVFSLAPATGPDGAAAAEKTRQLISHVGRVVHEGLGGWEWDGVKLAVGVGEAGGDDVDEWDELCAEAGLEFVQIGGDAQDRMQQFGEKSGIPRIKEALEANEWEDQGNANDGVDQDANNDTSAAQDPENMDFGLGQAPDLESLKKAIWAGATTAEAEEEQHAKKDRGQEDEDTHKDDIGDEDVAKVEAMMRKLQAAREAGETMSETQRRKMAAKAVQEVMREL